MQKMHKKFDTKIHGFASKVAPKKVAKKIVPTTMIIAESLTGLSAHANDFSNPITHNALHYNKTISYLIKNENSHEKIIENKLISITPRNNYKKNSNCLREKYNGSVEDLNYFLEKLIPKKDGKKDYNPFYEQAEVFIKAGEKYNVNPTVLIAIGMQESGRGTSRAAREMKNIGGIYLKNKHAHFKKLEDCVDIMASTINKRINENHTTIEKIGNSGKYCEKSASDVWIKNVMFYLNRM